MEHFKIFYMLYAHIICIAYGIVIRDVVNIRWYCLFQEGQRTGIKIMKFIITDLDSLANGPPFSFDIISGNRDGEFHVDSNGVLYTAGRMSKQVSDYFS